MLPNVSVRRLEGRVGKEKMVANKSQINRISLNHFYEIFIIYFVKFVLKTKKLSLKISHLSIIVTYHIWRGRLYETYQFCMNEEQKKLRKALGSGCSNIVFPSKESAIFLVFFYFNFAKLLWDLRKNRLIKLIRSGHVKYDFDVDILEANKISYWFLSPAKWYDATCRMPKCLTSYVR